MGDGRRGKAGPVTAGFVLGLHLVPAVPPFINSGWHPPETMPSETKPDRATRPVKKG